MPGDHRKRQREIRGDLRLVPDDERLTPDADAAFLQLEALAERLDDERAGAGEPDAGEHERQVR